jgi:hypothetical protein
MAYAMIQLSSAACNGAVVLLHAALMVDDGERLGLGSRIE